MNNFNNRGQYYYNPNQPNSAAVQNMMYQQAIANGKRIQKKEIRKVGYLLGGAIISYLILQTIMVSLLQVFGYMDLFESSTLFKYGFNIVAIHLVSMSIPFGAMALIMKKNFVKPFFPTEKVGKVKGAAWINFGMACCFLSNVFVGILIKFSKDVLGYKLTQNEYGDADSIFTLFIMFIASVVAPAIFEELAFRCSALGILRKYGNGFAIFAVSIVFGLIHGNVIQFVFAFIIGAVLAYITIKTNNILIPMTIHALTNGMSVLQDTIKYFSNEKTALLVTNIVFYVWAILGIISFIYLLTTKSFLLKKAEKNPYDNGFFVKLGNLLPGLAVPFIILIILTSKYVTKV